MSAGSLPEEVAEEVRGSLADLRKERDDGFSNKDLLNGLREEAAQDHLRADARTCGRYPRAVRARDPAHTSPRSVTCLAWDQK